MRISRYNVSFKINENENIIFNTRSRKYVLFRNNEELGAINETIDALIQQNYDNTELFKNVGILIADNENELEEIKFREHTTMYQDQCFKLTIQPTLDCNFRCSYCYEKHIDMRMEDQTIENILKFIDKITRKVNKLIINWFGGEPLLEADSIIILCENINKICKNNNCSYESALITNGYLLNNDLIKKIDLLNLRKIQITIDGIDEIHDLTRMYMDGTGTFEKIYKNLIEALNTGIYITLRINVSNKNYNCITQLFDMIPEEKRSKVIISLANIFQEKDKISLFELNKLAIEKGYAIGNVFHNTFICEGAIKNSLLINPEGKISSCAMAAEKGIMFGKIDNEGNIKFDNKTEFFKIRNIIASNEVGCSECVKLPLCYGGCKLNRYLNKGICNWNNPTGMTLEERIKLRYLQDTLANRKVVDII